MGYEAQVPSRGETVTLRGLPHRVLRWGPPSDDPVLLLHGFLDCAETFQFLVDALPRDWSFVALDWRGFGGSGWNDAPYWFPDYLGDLEAFLDVLGVAGAPRAAAVPAGDAGRPPEAPGRALRVIGHSMGGNVASLYAGIRPGRFRWLVSLEGFGLPRMSPEQAPARYAEWLDELREPVRNSRYESVAQLATVLRRRNARLPPAHAEFLAAAWSRPRADGGIELRADPWHRLVNPILYRREEAEACWRRADAPMLLVFGGESEFHRRLGDDGTHAYYHSIFSRLEIAEVPGAGHMMHHEAPEAVAAAITAWVARQR
jgi:pimeloyl-ACP methyl ester carboxylesterase